jgi:hypothetical protein
VTDEEILILIRARDEFSQAARAARSGLVDLDKEVQRLGGVERASAQGARELVRWHNILAGEARKNEAQVSSLNKRLEELNDTQLEFTGFGGLGRVAPQLGPTAAEFSPLAAGMAQYSRDATAATASTKELTGAQKEVAVAQNKTAVAAKQAGLHIGSLGIKTEFTGFQMLRFAAAIGGAQLGISVMATTVIGLRNAIISTNAQIETATLQFKILTGDADVAKERIADLIDFARRTPFEVAPIIQASRVLRTFGGDVLDNNKTLRLIGDTAAATGTDLQNLTFWISRAYSALQDGRPFGEAATRLQELAVLTPEVRRQIEVLGEQGKNAEAFEVLMRSLTRFTGALEEQAETWQGSTSTAIDSSRLLLAEGFKPLFDGLKEVIINFGAGAQSGEGFASKLAAVMQVLVDVLRPLIVEVSKSVKAFTELPPQVQLLFLTFGAIVTIGPAVAGALVAINAALANQVALIAANPWLAATLAIGAGLVVAMRVFRQETEKTNDALKDQITQLERLQRISREELVQELATAQTVLTKAITEQALFEDKLARGEVVGHYVDIVKALKEGNEAIEVARDSVNELTSDLTALDRVVEKGEITIRREILALEEEQRALIASREALDEINFKRENHIRLTDEEREESERLAAEITRVNAALDLARSELDLLDFILGKTTGSVADLTSGLREAREELLGLSASSVAQQLTLDLASLNDEFDRGAITFNDLFDATGRLFESAIFDARKARGLQETAKSLEEFITAITGLGAKEETAKAAKAGPTAIDLLLEALQRLADQGGPAIDEARQKLEQFHSIAQESGDVLAVALIDRFFELEFSISEANRALGILTARLGDLPELPDLEGLAAEARKAAIEDIDLLGGLLETALKRQAQAVLDGIINGLAAERDALESLQRQATEIVEGAQVDMSDAVHIGTQQRIRDIIAEANVLRNTIGAEIEEIQRRLDQLNARDFAQDLEIIDRQLKLAFDPREAQRLLDRREQVVRRHEEQQLRDRQRELEQQLRDEQAALVDKFRSIIDERMDILDRFEETARESFKEVTDAFKLESEVRRLLLEEEVDEMARLLDEFVPEWRTAGLSYGEQLIDGIRASGVLEFISGIFSNISNAGGIAKQTTTSLSEAQIADLQLRGADLSGEMGKNSAVVRRLRDALIEQGVVPSFREGGFARSPTLAVIGDRPGGEFTFGGDQLRQVIREEAGASTVNVRVFVGDREITDIVRTEVEMNTRDSLGRGARLFGTRT